MAMGLAAPAGIGGLITYNQHKKNQAKKEGLAEGGLGQAITWGGRGLAGLDLSMMGTHGGKALHNKRKEKKQMQQHQESAFAEDQMREISTSSLSSVGSRISNMPWSKADTALLGTSAGMGVQRKARDFADDRRLNSSQKPIYDERAYKRSSYDPLRRRQGQQYREA